MTTNKRQQPRYDLDFETADGEPELKVQLTYPELLDLRKRLEILIAEAGADWSERNETMRRLFDCLAYGIHGVRMAHVKSRSDQEQIRKLAEHLWGSNVGFLQDEGTTAVTVPADSGGSVRIGFKENAVFTRPKPPGERLELKGSPLVQYICQRISIALFKADWERITLPATQAKIYNVAAEIASDLADDYPGVFDAEELAKSKVDHPAGRKKPALGPNENGMQVVTLEEVFAIRALLELLADDSYEPDIERAKETLKRFARD